MRLVVVSTGIPHIHFHKKLSASLMILYSYVEELKKAGIEMLHVLVLDKKTYDEELLERYRREMEEPGKLAIIAWHTPSLVQPRRRSFHAFHPVHVPPDIHERIKTFHPDAFFCLDVYAVGSLIDAHVAPILVQVHDPKFQTLWHHSLYAFKERPSQFPSVAMDLFKAMLWWLYYRRVLKHADRVVTVAKSGEVLLKRMGIPAKHFPMLWMGVRGADSSPVTSLPTVPTFLFQGNLSGLGSRSALHFLFEEAYPHMRRLWGEKGFRLLLCGTRSLPAWVAAKIRSMPEVEFLGFVYDIALLMRSCHAVLAPIDIPVGNRTRILTALSLRVPVVAHRTISLTNPRLVDGDTCYLAADPKDFVAKMKLACERGPEVMRIIERGKQVFDEEFSPPAATSALLAELQALIREKKA